MPVEVGAGLEYLLLLESEFEQGLREQQDRMEKAAEEKAKDDPMIAGRMLGWFG
jgi:ATP-dependent protease HslVU (ClpYQ) peptidase subunit